MRRPRPTRSGGRPPASARRPVILPMALSLALAVPAALPAGAQEGAVRPPSASQGAGARVGASIHVSAPAAAPATDQAAPTSARLAAFEKRSAAGRGVFITRADLERRRAGRLSDLLRGTPGVTLVRLDGMGVAVASARPGSHGRFGLGTSSGSHCFLDVLLDGVRLTPAPNSPPVDIDDIAPARLAGIEIHRAGAVPIDLQVGVGSCGVIALWSREP